MRICVFSDIHGNGPAFRVAYEMIISEKADINIFLGDLCGYYFDQKEIFFMLKTIPNLIALKGNHDSMYLQIVFNKDEDLRLDYFKKYGNSIEHLLNQEVEEFNQWLTTLPESYVHSNSDFAFYHGSPWNHLDGYVYPDSPIENFLDYSATLFVLGHTHYPMKRKIEDRLILNPGSLGQPRNGRWPTYAIINFPAKEVVFKEVFYDKIELFRQIDKLDKNNKYLKNILFRQINYG